MHTGVVPKTIRTVVASCTMQQVHRTAQTACRPSLPRPRGVCAFFYARIECAQCPAVVAQHVNQRNSCQICEILFKFDKKQKTNRWEMVHRPEVGAAMCLRSLFVAPLKRLFCEGSPFPSFFVNECDSCVTSCVRARDLTVSFRLAGPDCLFHSACLPLTPFLSTSAPGHSPPAPQRKRKIHIPISSMPAPLELFPVEIFTNVPRAEMSLSIPSRPVAGHTMHRMRSGRCCASSP